MGLYEDPKKILACSHYNNNATARYAYCVKPGVRCGAVYLHSFLKLGMKNIFLLLESTVFAEMILKFAWQISSSHAYRIARV